MNYNDSSTSYSIGQIKMTLSSSKANESSENINDLYEHEKKIIFVIYRWNKIKTTGDMLVLKNRIEALKASNIKWMIIRPGENTEESNNVKILPALNLTDVIKNLIKSFWNRESIQRNLWSSSKRKKTISRILSNYSHRNDQIVCITVRSISLLPSNIDKKTLIIENIDSLSKNMKDISQKKSPLLRWIYKREASTLEKEEFDNIASVKSSIFVSSRCRSKYSCVRNASMWTICQGVDTKIFKPRQKNDGQRDEFKIIFFGNLNYEPNKNALQRLEKIMQICTDSSIFLYIVGRGRYQATNKSANIIYIGPVENMAEELIKYDAMLAPMQIGTGVQNKLLESMACGLPVITTSHGVGSLNCTNNKDIIIRDEDKEIVEAINSLKHDHSLRNNIKDNALKTIDKFYSIASLAHQIKASYDI